MARKKRTRTQRAHVLRQQAERRLRNDGGKASGVVSRVPKVPKEARKLLHQLQVHQIELEMQNEELIRAQDVIEESRIKYLDLYEFALAGNVTVDKDGHIVEANLAALTLLGCEREFVLDRPIAQFISRDSLPVFRSFFSNLREPGKEETCQLTLRHRNKRALTVLCKGARSRTSSDTIRLALHDDTERAHMVHELMRSHQQLGRLSARLEQVREEERGRIAHEIHDVLGQTLTGLKLDIGWLGQQLKDAEPAVLAKLRSMTKLIDETTQIVRDIATELRPVILDQLGLLPAIEWLVQEFQSRTGVPSKVNVLLRQVKLGPEQSTAIFRIVQEILTNIARHAEATEVLVTVRERMGELLIEARDNGRGITNIERGNPNALGLAGMRHRALLMGGELLITGIPGIGTTVMVRAPLSEQRGKGELIPSIFNARSKSREGKV